MKNLTILILMLMPLTLVAQTTAVTHVVTHNRTTVVCDPVEGVRPFAAWGLFPEDGKPVRRIIMHVTLGSPDSIMTAHWDYLDHIRILRRGGVKGERLGYELGRMLTPYGSVFGKGWSWEWETDVTDFAPFLRDSVEIEYTHSGYEAVTVGWALTIDFEIITGPPVADFMGIVPLWDGGFRYGDPGDRIEDRILPVSYTTGVGVAISRIRIQHTGHGMDMPRGCSEFCSRWRQIVVDGAVADNRYMWKDCGANPLYPQGGTWVYDRAYWCPGDLQIPDIIDVPAAPGRHSVALFMEPYTATENVQAVENIAAYMFLYAKPKQKNDVAIEQIVVPTGKQQYSRRNPAAFNPTFVIRNLGSENLRSADISYGTEGFARKTFTWRGDLRFNQTAEIVIPDAIDSKAGDNTFMVTLSRPNGRRDAWEGDNSMTSHFASPVCFPTQFIVQFKTNNRPVDNRIFIVGSGSDTLFMRVPAAADSNRLFLDTISLDRGAYEFSLTDTAGDGLEFWAEPQYGDGYLRLFDIRGNLIHAFESDCGNGQRLSFVADPSFVTDTVTPRYAFSLYPRLVESNMDLSVVSNRTSDMTVIITVGGTVFEKHEYMGIKNASYTYNLSNMPAGRIVVEVFMDGVSSFKGRVNKMRKRHE